MLERVQEPNYTRLRDPCKDWLVFRVKSGSICKSLRRGVSATAECFLRLILSAVLRADCRGQGCSGRNPDGGGRW